MVLRNSLVYSRRIGIYAAIGLGFGICVHVAYSLAGTAVIISQSVILFNVIKLLGASYLIFIGIKSILAKKSTLKVDDKQQKQDLTPLQAIRTGFITNAINPKATLFFLSLFTLVIQPETPLAIKLIMGAEMAIVTTVWFSIIAIIISQPAVRKRFTATQHHVERFMGGVLIIFGLKLATTHAK